MPLRFLKVFQFHRKVNIKTLQITTIYCISISNILIHFTNKNVCYRLLDVLRIIKERLIWCAVLPSIVKFQQFENNAISFTTYLYTTSKVIVSSKISKINCKKLLFRLSFSRKANSTFKVQEIFKIPVLSMRNWATKFCWFRSEPFSCPWSFPLDKSVTQIIFLKKRRNFYINYQSMKSRLSQLKSWQKYWRCLHFYTLNVIRVVNSINQAKY